MAADAQARHWLQSGDGGNAEAARERITEKIAIATTVEKKVHIGLAISMIGASHFVGNLLAGWLVDRLSPQRLAWLLMTLPLAAISAYEPFLGMNSEAPPPEEGSASIASGCSGMS